MSNNQDYERQSSHKGPHRDYQFNLRRALQFCKSVEKSLPPGLRVYVGNSHGLTDSLLFIAFRPPMTEKMGNYVTPIFLDQSKDDVSNQTEAVFNNYLNMAKKFDAPPQQSKIISHQMAAEPIMPEQKAENM